MSSNSWYKKPNVTENTEAAKPSDPSKNATRHGCCAADATLLANESAADFKALQHTWFQAYNPKTDIESHLIFELTNADWLLQRSTRAYLQVETALYAANPNPAEWTEEQERKLGRFLRYKTAHTNNVNKCRKAVEDYRKDRLREKVTAEKQTMAQERHKAAQKKSNQTDPTWKEHLDNMRKQAESMGFKPPPADPTKR